MATYSDMVNPSLGDLYDLPILYKGKHYYRVKDHEKIRKGSLHCLSMFRIYDEETLNPIQNSTTPGKTPNQFIDRKFFNPYPRPATHKKHKIETFDINNLYLGE